MSLSYFSLLLLLSAPWMGNAMPAESAKPTSRDSRQMMFPVGVVPWQQPSDFYKYDTSLYDLHPMIKQRLLKALVTAVEAASENPSFSHSYKAGAQPNKSNPFNFDPTASGGALFQSISHLLPYSREQLKEMESRLGYSAVLTIVVNSLVAQLLAVGMPMIIDAITNAITDVLAG